MRVVGKEGALEGGGGVNENYDLVCDNMGKLFLNGRGPTLLKCFSPL